jgi:electron transfer flavoprotein alpha subunit
VATPAGGEVWAFLETAREGLHETATQAASEARRMARLLEGRACGVIAGMPEKRLLEELAPFGLERIYALRGDPESPRTAEEHARAVATLAERRSPSFLLFAATPLGCEAAARVAARRKSGLVSDCVDFARGAEGFTARRNVYGGKAHAKVAWRGPPPWVATISLDALEAIPESTGQLAEVVAEDGDFGAPRTELVCRWRVEPREVDLSEARIVVGIGKPILQRPADLSIIEEVAERLGAALGGSRVVVDAGLLPRARQIGASGKWLTADVYLACGVSGSSYHMMGVKAVKHLLAVNLDRSAPIFQNAELGVVGDLFEVLPALSALLGPADPKGGDER